MKRTRRQPHSPGSRHRGLAPTHQEYGHSSASRTRLIEALGGGMYAVATEGLIKIGWTGNLKNRLSGLGGYGNILALDLAATLDDEQELHRRLSGHAVRGNEWYSPDDSAVIAEVNAMRSRIGLASI